MTQNRVDPKAPEIPNPWEMIGGWRGTIEAAIPAVVYGIALTLVSRSQALGIALGAAAVITLVRLVMRDKLLPALSGFLGVLIAVVFASMLHSSAAFYLPNILANAAYGLACLVSILIGKPVLGYIAGFIDARYRGWQNTGPQKRAAVWATSVWVVVFGARVILMGGFYLLDWVGALTVGKVVLGVPLYALGILASFAFMRRALPHDAEPVDSIPRATEPLVEPTTQPAGAPGH